MKILSKILVFSFFLLSTFCFLSSPTFAEASAGKPAYAASQAASDQSAVTTSSTDSNVPSNLHNWTQTVMIEVMSSLTCQLAGVDPINPKQSCLGADQKTGKIGFLPSPQTGGVIGFMGTMITALYTPPLHTSDYFHNLAQNFGINKKVYADTTGGTGFQSLTPLINMWTMFRNIAYLILVIVFVVIGLAIMLRVKIDPRTVMTIQNQIPKIIVGILAITFSFAIAGFLVDIMWIFIYLFYNVITQAAGGHELIKSAALQSSTPFGALGAGNSMSVLWEVSKGVGTTIVNFLGVDSLLHLARNNTNVFAQIGLGIGWILDQIVGGILGIVGGIITFIVISLALLIALFKIWLSLIKAYVTILLDVVLAPFWIIGGIIPGSPISFGGWLKDLAANLLAFPVTIAMFMFAIVFKDLFVNNPATKLFFPPLIGNAADTGSGFIGAIISLGIILITPNVVDLLKQMLKAPKSDIMGGAIKGLGAGTGTAMAGGRALGASLAKTPKMGERGGPMGALRGIFKF